MLGRPTTATNVKGRLPGTTEDLAIVKVEVQVRPWQTLLKTATYVNDRLHLNVHRRQKANRADSISPEGNPSTRPLEGVDIKEVPSKVKAAIYSKDSAVPFESIVVDETEEDLSDHNRKEVPFRELHSIGRF